MVQVCSKIMARAVQIIDYRHRPTGQEDPTEEEEVKSALDCQQARIYCLQGRALNRESAAVTLSGP